MLCDMRCEREQARNVITIQFSSEKQYKKQNKNSNFLPSIDGSLARSAFSFLSENFKCASESVRARKQNINTPTQTHKMRRVCNSEKMIYRTL